VQLNSAALGFKEEKMGERRVEMEGRTYVWTGRDWYDKTTNIKPPRPVLHKLEAWLAAQPLGIDEKLDLAKRARADKNLWLAEQLLRELFRDHPHHRGVAVQLSGVLRDRGLPEEALTITAPLVSSSYAPIFTTRAAALCDLGRWEEAKQEVARALALGKEDEAFAVVGRIKKARPDLYA
jgi:hypothetical protein